MLIHPSSIINPFIILKHHPPNQECRLSRNEDSNKVLESKVEHIKKCVSESQLSLILKERKSVLLSSQKHYQKPSDLQSTSKIKENMKRRVKRVRFDITDNSPNKLHSSCKDKKESIKVHIISIHKPSKEEISQVHNQEKDYEYFCGTAHFIAAEVYDRAIRQQQNSQISSFTYDKVMTMTYQLCVQYSNDVRLNMMGSPKPSCANIKRNKSHPLDFQPNSCQRMSYLLQNSSEVQTTKALNSTLTQTNNNIPYHHDETIKDGSDFSPKSKEFSLPPRLFEGLVHWVKNGHTRRGLEKLSVPHYAQARPLSQKRVTNAVLIAQQFLKNQREKRQQWLQEKIDEADDIDPQKLLMWKETEKHQRILDLKHLGVPSGVISPTLLDGEVLRIISEQYTRASKYFALAMGYADAAAAKMNEN